MIARVYDTEVSRWTPVSEASLKQCGQFTAYGAARDFLCFYEDERGNRLSVMDGAATLYVTGEPEEMLLFLTMDPTVRSVRTDCATAERLAELWNTDVTCEAVMQAPAADVDARVELCEDFKGIYDVLTDGFGVEALPPFDVWYADVHHRHRHGCCRVVCVREGGDIVASAMTVAECDKAAHIGAVATRTAARGKGYASACVLTLSALLQREQKQVFLSPKNAYAHALYERIGFTVVGEWGSVIKP